MINSHQFISPSGMHAEMQADNQPLLVDVREPAEFAQGHAQGAKNIPLGQVSRDKLQQLDFRWQADSQPVYLICEAGFRALQAAETLYQQGVEQTVVVEGGTDAWQASQLPMIGKKSKLLSLERQTQIALGVLLLVLLFKGVLVHPGFYLLIGVVATGLVVAGVTAKCSLTSLLARMPWNQQGSSTA